MKRIEKKKCAVIAGGYLFRTLEIETGKNIAQAPHAVKQANPPVRKSG
jgi:hypothetical protein